MAKKETALAIQDHSTLMLGASLFHDEVAKIIEAKTPANEVAKVPGTSFDYVRVGYMRRQMEDAFPMSWDVEFFETANAETLLKAKAIVVKARVTVRDPGTRTPLLVREAYGGSGIKLYGAGKKNKDGIDISGTPVALENDYKSAQADAMKKAISLFGICSDIYESVVDRREDEREEAATTQVQAVAAVKQRIEIDPETGITKEAWQFIVAEAAAKKVPLVELQKFLVERGWRGEDGKAKPSLVKNRDIPTIETWIADAPPF